ncbi:MAG: hypothetical protein Ct9H300mP25_00540 [Acidobacteriota bacterium]|nr:MAG: hypothetical protein Ct9H300mP25_00540 [Acidobacteriota bacterium]
MCWFQEALPINSIFIEPFQNTDGLESTRGLTVVPAPSEYTPIFYRYKELVPIESGIFGSHRLPRDPGGQGGGAMCRAS